MLRSSRHGFYARGTGLHRVITSDLLGEQIGSSPAATQLGQILDADTYFNPSDSQVSFATPAALSFFPKAYDLESVLTHELGHVLGFGRSAVWSAMMYPYAPLPGTFTGTRPTMQQADAPLGEDDRTGLRILYPNSADPIKVGIIRGRILPANPLSLPASPPRVSGIFGVHVVAVDQSSGAVIAATVGGSQLHRICRAARRRGSSRADQPIHRYPVPQSHQRSRLAATAGMRRPHSRHKFHNAHPLTHSE